MPRSKTCAARSPKRTKPVSVCSRDARSGAALQPAAREGPVLAAAPRDRRLPELRIQAIRESSPRSEGNNSIGRGAGARGPRHAAARWRGSRRDSAPGREPPTDGRPAACHPQPAGHYRCGCPVSRSRPRIDSGSTGVPGGRGSSSRRARPTRAEAVSAKVDGRSARSRRAASASARRPPRRSLPLPTDPGQPLRGRIATDRRPGSPAARRCRAGARHGECQHGAAELARRFAVDNDVRGVQESVRTRNAAT